MSDKPVAEKLQVKGERRLAVLGAPRGLDAVIGGARAGVEAADVILLFTADRAGFERDLPLVAAQARKDAILWVAYVKLTSPLAGDLNRDVIHALAPAHGLDTVSQIAIDQDWSALRLKRLA